MELRKIIRAAEAQGWRVEEKKAGYMFFPADRALTGVMWHLTASDHRAERNFRAEMTKRGFQWPKGA